MSKQNRVLLKLVALKRQRAEQGLAIAQARRRELQAGLADLQAQLAAADAAQIDFQALSLSARNGHVQRLLNKLADQQAQVEQSQACVAEAREELKRILNSEDQLLTMGPAALP
ncbi:MAG: hypothetical protein GYB49_15570 [Alphaproteobacteria bacterium]|nr:hypothetical protein [Alphaproteobacteria bacterium]|tara:strand:+ start:20096 stop:20437 length:342 start_codon:yes stop_codon:yes gene_type:complete